MRLRLIGIVGAAIAGAAGTAVTAPAATTSAHVVTAAMSGTEPAVVAHPARRLCGDPGGGDGGGGGGQAGGNA